MFAGVPPIDILNSSPEHLFEHLGSNKGSSDGRVSVGVARATLAGVAPEPLKESWTPFEVYITISDLVVPNFPFRRGVFVWEGASDPRLPVFPIWG